MNQSTNTGGLDKFRLAGALLVVAIHTSPLTCISAEADFFLTRILARVAVPFFLMVTGQFVLPRILEPGVRAGRRLLRYLESLRHDSMYILLVPVMYCLYGLLLCSNCPPCPRLRRISTLIYILHPAVIVAVRIFARLPHMLPLMEQSLLHYAAVCLLSLAAAWLLTGLRDIKIKRGDHDR